MDASTELFKNSLRGPLFNRDDKEYDEARKVYNAMIDRKPAMIVRCKDAGDVIECVNYARNHDLPVAIRGGGHSGPGFGVVDDGLVIDLSGMRGIRVDPASETAWVEAGCTWGDVDHATHAFGLATVSGIVSSTGVAGLTLGGGHGYLTRKYGLTIDNLLEADVVLADGRFVTANKDSHPDLFWALRGGGGNFGVVTAFRYQLHPVKNIIAGPMFWPIDELEPTLKWYREWLPDASEDFGTFYLVAEVPAVEPFPKEIHGEKVCGVMWFSTGDEDEFSAAVTEAREIADPLFEFTGKMPYPAVQSMFDGLFPTGYQWYWKGDFVHSISDEAVEQHLKFREVPTTLSAMHLYPINGAVHRVKEDDTAWNKRDANWSMVIVGVDPDPINNGLIKRWAKNYWEALHPHNKGGAYINFMMEEGEDRIRANYGKNFERLQQVKTKYDPDNLFRVNQNIVPKNGVPG